MHIEITIPRDEWAEMLDQVLPIKIQLDEDATTERWLRLLPYSSFELVPGQGLRVSCPAELHWSTAIGELPLKLNELRVMVKPQIEDRREGASLVLEPLVEETDFARLPEVVDRGVMVSLNAQLKKRDLSWNFTRAISQVHVPLSEKFDVVQSLSLVSSNASCIVDAQAIRVRADLAAKFERTP